MTLPMPYRSFKAGDQVLSCDPWVWALESQDEYSRYCAFCFAERLDLLTCSKCKLHRYCDDKCQMADWKLQHKVECMVLKTTDNCTKIVHFTTGQRGLMALILMSKIAIKLLPRGIRETLVGLGTKTAREILDSLPSYPQNEKLKSFFDFTMLQKIHPKQLFPALNPFCSQFQFADFVRLIEHNAFPIFDPGAKKRIIGAALVPQAPFRAMTPVCWDSNVILDFRGRKFVIYATEDIAQYTGFSDLRYSELLKDPSFLAPTERRRLFQEIYSRPCDCRKCTPAYEAEINPLKCVAPGCTERIPSDERALVPCPQCGAFINPDKLQQIKRFVNKLEKIRKRSRLNGTHEDPDYAEETALLEETDTSGVLHADAHIRFLVGWHRVGFHRSEGRIAEAWELCKGLVSCVREIIPRYHIRRAFLLMEAGICLAGFIRKLENMESDASTRQEAHRLLADLFNPPRMCFDFCKEARQIYRRIYGEDSKQARDARGCHKVIEGIEREMTNVVRLLDDNGNVIGLINSTEPMHDIFSSEHTVSCNADVTQ